MRLFTQLIPMAALLLAYATAQNSSDPSGHWEAVIQAQGQEVKIEIDLGKNSKGDLIGAFAQPAQGVKGLPLSQIAVEGRSVRFVLKADVQPVIFAGVLSADGKSITGDLALAGESIPFHLARTGDAKFTAVPKSAPIGKELEGTWNGTLETAGGQMRLTLKMANQPDGTAAGTIVSVDGSGVEIPITIKQNAANLAIDLPTVGASFTGVLNPAGTELTGTWTQQSLTLPLTFQRAK
jgi:hypothetical protein